MALGGLHGPAGQAIGQGHVKARGPFTAQRGIRLATPGGRVGVGQGPEARHQGQQVERAVIAKGRVACVGLHRVLGQPGGGGLLQRDRGLRLEGLAGTQPRSPTAHREAENCQGTQG